MIDMSGPIFVVSCGTIVNLDRIDCFVVLAICNHFNWFFFFKTKYFVFNELVSFFGICVWLIPFMLLISLSANDMTLPYGKFNEIDLGAFDTIW